MGSRLYQDGDLIRCVSRKEIGDRWVMDQPQKVWLDSETFPWEIAPEKLNAEDFPGDGRKFIVDYVRVWQSDSRGQSCAVRQNLLANSHFEEGLKNWHVGGKAKIQSGQDESYMGNQHVSIEGGGKSSIEQSVAVQPNTPYILSAWARSPATDGKKQIFEDAWLGVKNFDNGFRTVRFFENGWNRKSIQFRTGPNAERVTVFFTNEWSQESALVDHLKLVEIPVAPHRD